MFKLKNTYSVLLWPNRRSFEQICSGNESDTNVFLGKFFLCVRLIVYIFLIVYMLAAEIFFSIQDIKILA